MAIQGAEKAMKNLIMSFLSSIIIMIEGPVFSVRRSILKILMEYCATITDRAS